MSATNTVFNKKAIQKALNVTPEKMVNVLQESMAIGDNGEVPRNYSDFLVSISLGNKLPLYNPTEINTLEAWKNDFKITKPEDRVKTVFVFDTETTGYKGYAVSVAGILYDIESGEVIEEFYELVNPGVEIPADSTKVHGIKEEHIQDAKTFEEIWPELYSMISKADMLVGQNLKFDIAVFERELERINQANPIDNAPYFDTMVLAKKIVQAKDKNGRKIKDPKLEEIVEHYGIELEDYGYHNALVDTRATLEVFKAMIA